MRTILRFSINGESNSKLRNALAEHLKVNQFVKTGTASWENQNIAVGDLAATMSRFWEIVSDPVVQAGADAGVSVDHVWTYSDDSDA